MIERWGWDAFAELYWGMDPPENGSHTQALDAALVKHFSISFDQLEQDFLVRLQSELVTGNQIEDVRLTVEYFDTVRRYQQSLDPSAYFRTAWLLDNQQMRERGIVADYLRRPIEPENISIELLLSAASEQLAAGFYAEADRYLLAVNRALDALEAGQPVPAYIELLN
jgi:hypothetical protein